MKWILRYIAEWLADEVYCFKQEVADFKEFWQDTFKREEL